jgi:hypothetical protein
MVKQMISFTVPQLRFLRRLAKKRGLSVAEVVRRILDEHIEDRASPIMRGREGPTI